MWGCIGVQSEHSVPNKRQMAITTPGVRLPRGTHCHRYHWQRLAKALGGLSGGPD